MKPKELENYLVLLNIRYKAKRRDTIISGAAFFISFVLIMALVLLARLSGNSLYLMIIILVCFAFCLPDKLG